ncbi:MAG: hypothetical protein K0R03_494 [Moraxellaceae bacterium]|nr:hypothetical protein [Moraxellaceae bacterium]
MALIRRLNTDPAYDANRLSVLTLELSSSRPAGMSTLASACNMPENDCLLALAQGITLLRRWVQEEQWLLNRYRALLTRKGWQEPIPLDFLAPWPPYGDAYEGQKLLLAQALLLARDGDIGRARALLEDDARFWRRVLVDTEYLVVKMVAVAALRRHMLWTSLITRSLPPEQMHDVVAPQWQMPLGNDELSMRRVLAGEWSFSDKFMRDIAADHPRMRVPAESRLGAWTERLFSLLQRPLLQPQDSSNRHAEVLGRLSDALDRVTFAEFAVRYREARDVEAQVAQTYGKLRPYNVIHNVIMSVQEPVFYEYWVRTADLEGLRRAMLLTIELRSRGVTSASVEKAVQEATLRNPYTNAAFAWDSERGGILFTGMAAGDRGRYLFVY